MQVTHSGFFALRTPLLPYAVLEELTSGLNAPHAVTAEELSRALEADRALVEKRLRDRVLDPHIREALFVASPSFDAALTAWLEDSASPRAHDVPHVLLRYVGRMAARATPFGLFSGCSVGEIGQRTRFELAPRGSYTRHTRLDTHYLAALCDALHADPVVRNALRFRPSTGLYRIADQLRYAEGRVDSKTRARTYHLVSVQSSAPLETLLAKATDGARPSELERALLDADAELDPAEVSSFVEQVIQSQIVVSELAPIITGGEPIRGVLETLETAGTGLHSALSHAAESIKELDAGGLGVAPQRYRAVARALEELPAKVEMDRLFQVDLRKPVVRAELGGAALREIERGVELLARIAVPMPHEGLRRFREAFVARYEGRTVPLVEALDEEAGLGFTEDGSTAGDPSPLLENVDFPGDGASPTLAYGAREVHLARGISESIAAGRAEWKLGEEDLEALAAKSGPVAPPPSFAVMASIAAASEEAVAEGDFRILIQSITGPSGANLLGRFCHADALLRDHVEAHLRAEEAGKPEALFAEIVHLPEGRVGNVLCRPALRPYAIPYLGVARLQPEQLLPITDLCVTVDGDRIVLSSRRLGREVVPRLTSAHNHSASALGIYRFLAALQYQDRTHALAWAWGPHAQSPFLPRVSHGRHILSLAQWNLDKRALSAFVKREGTALYRAASELRGRLGIPRWVSLEDGDNILPFDLESIVHLESLARLLASRSSATFLETFPGGDALVARGPEGAFLHEIIVPFVRTSLHDAPPPAPVPRRRDANSVQRSFVPGSEWLYVKLYAGTAGADRILADVALPVLEAARADGELSRWFFIRYSDPQWHVRFRVRASRSYARSVLLAKVQEVAAPLLENGRLARVALDTYEREIERYGGDEGIELAEAVFEADSNAALAIITSTGVPTRADSRWRLALRGMHLLLSELGLDLDARLSLARGARAALGREYHLDAASTRQLGVKFRAVRDELAALLAGEAGEEHDLAPGFAVLADRTKALRPVFDELRACAAADALSEPLDGLAASFLHMHVNRMLRSEQRRQELVLYDFLARLYDSERARTLGRAR